MSKPFSQLSPLEIENMPEEEWKAVSPFDKKSCYDCDHIVSAMSNWCGSELAKKARGTTIPGVIKCPYWKPSWKHIPGKYKTKENGYKVKEIFFEPTPLAKESWFYKLFKKGVKE